MKRSFLTLFILFLVGKVCSQTSLSLYHLGNSTFQNTWFNAAVVPEGKLFIGLPVLSGVHVNYNNKLSYNETFTKTREGEQRVDLGKILGRLQNNNMVSVKTHISLLHIGYTAPTGATIYLFANERIEVDVLYPKSLIELAEKGNARLIEEKIKFGKTRLNATHFREIGVGYRYKLKDFNLGIGARLKYYQGFFNMSTPGNVQGSLITESENYQLNLEIKNAILRSSGKNIYEGDAGDLGSHLISNGNSGLGLDLGFTYDIDKYNTITGSINDLGFISWKEDIENKEINDTTFRYTGLTLKGSRDLVQELKDSVFKKFSVKDNFDPYTTMVSPTMYASWIYHFTPYNDITTTVGSRIVSGQVKMLYGVGINQRFGGFFTGSINVTRLPQQFLNLGAALAVKGGPVQFYLAADQITNWSAPDFQALDFRLGINLIFGGPHRTSGTAGPRNSRFLGNKVRARGKEGIYTIINKQKRRKKSSYMSSPK